MGQKQVALSSEGRGGPALETYVPSFQMGYSDYGASPAGQTRQLEGVLQILPGPPRVEKTRGTPAASQGGGVAILFLQAA